MYYINNSETSVSSVFQNIIEWYELRIMGVINALSLDNSEPEKFRINSQGHCREDATGELHRQVP